jgi:hypothetical protein
VLGSGATVVTNKRKIAADDFFKGMYETALAADEVITAVSFPCRRRPRTSSFRIRVQVRVGGRVRRADGNGVRVAVTGAAPSVFRSKPLEDALAKSFTADAAKAVKIDAKGLNADLHGSPEYRAHLIAVLASRAVTAARLNVDAAIAASTARGIARARRCPRRGASLRGQDEAHHLDDAFDVGRVPEVSTVRMGSRDCPLRFRSARACCRSRP